MSAWIVTKRHIDFIVTAAIAAELIAPSKADETGRMLWAENLKSVAYRYPRDQDGGRPGPVSFRDRHVDQYVWRETPVLRDTALYTTLACYDYQTCEHPEYHHSQALELIVKLGVNWYRGSGSDLDDATPWGWPDWEVA